MTTRSVLRERKLLCSVMFVLFLVLRIGLLDR